jgi:hypothetical protein
MLAIATETSSWLILIIELILHFVIMPWILPAKIQILVTLGWPDWVIFLIIYNVTNKQFQNMVGCGWL